MAKYRWGFEELDTSYTPPQPVFVECEPYVDNDTALEYSQETGQIFYRAKLSSDLDFRFEYDKILADGYDAVHIVVLQSYNEDTDAFEEIWRGKFTLTDCTVNADTHTITVRPGTIDNYTNVMDHIQDEYNMVKIKPKVQPIDIKIRPCLQLYSINDSKLTNYIGESYWEASANAVGNQTDLTDTYHFDKIAETMSCFLDFDYVHDGNLYRIKVIATGDPSTFEWEHDWPGGYDVRVFYISGSILDGGLAGTLTFPVRYYIFGNDIRFSINLPATQTNYKSHTLLSADIAEGEIGLQPVINLDEAYDGNVQYNIIYARCMLQTDLAQISLLDTVLDTYDIPSDDIAGHVNLNYNKVCPITTACVHFDSSSIAQAAPTQWGMSYYQDRYFVRFLEEGYNPLPVGISGWKYASLWVYPYFRYRNYIDQYSATRTIKDAYPLPSVIKQLFGKADSTIEFLLDNTEYSEFFFAYDFPVVEKPFRLYVTPRSNVISSYYNSPAQNAPITLLQILDMLKNVFKVYWYIDKDKKLHFEHISFFENGLSYDESNTVLIDLDTVRHTRTMNSKAYGQNTYKYDKQDMPSQYQFEWDDVQTLPFTSVPMKAKDAYVSQGQKEDINMSKFDADIDYILSTPDEIAKDGFALIACRYNGQNPGYATQITREITIKDEDGITVDYIVQNADCAMAMREKDMWRFHLPCENWLINNLEDTAKTTGNYKLQTVEFADLTMNDIVTDVSNCIKKIRTQQGDGSIKTLSINLNSFETKADLLFNFVGRWFYLRGTALQGVLTFTLNGETISINVGEDNTFVVKYKDPITALTFTGSNVVSVDFADTDNLNDLTTADNMFKNCYELIAVDFSNKTFAAVTSAVDMFAGDSNLTTLICPATNTWKPDVDFTDCPNLTLQSLNDFIVNYLYLYESGVHTITPNNSMWNNLDGATQDDLIAKATAKGWQIAIPAQYSISGTSAGSTVYASINGNAVEIEVTGGQWHYDYNTPISSIAFTNDTNLQTVDFSASDGLASLTTLADAFKGCSALTSVDFTNCDLSNVATAADAFANCSALTNLTIPTGTWKPDVDLSASIMPKSEMLNVINGLYTYTSGTHTITFNSTIWDAMSVADQQIVFDAADAKGWTTNAVLVVYVIRGTSTNVNGTETFNIQFINDGALSPSAAITITCAVDGDGNWEYVYINKRIYSLNQFARFNTTIQSVEFEEDFNALTDIKSAFDGCTNLKSIKCLNGLFNNVADGDYFVNNNSSLETINLPLATFEKLQSAIKMFAGNTSLTTLSLPYATFENLTIGSDGSATGGMFTNDYALQTLSLPIATFEELVDARYFMYRCYAISTLSMPLATFANVQQALGMFNFIGTPTFDFYLPSATFANCLNADGMFADSKFKTISLPIATFSAITSIVNLCLRCVNITEISMPLATFANVVNSANSYGVLYNCSSLTTIHWESATFDKLAYSLRFFYNCSALTSLYLPQNSTAIIKTSSAANAPMDLHFSPLDYASMLKIANWLSDLTGYSAHTCTFKSSAWNVLSSAEQTTIDGILSGKNWNRAIA